MRRRNLLTLLGAFLLRMIRLQARPLWYDEAFALLYRSLSPAQMIYGTVTPTEGAGAADVHPLLYYMCLRGWTELVGQSVFAARLLSVIFGMLTVALLWRLASWCFGYKTGSLVGILAAANPFHVAYSQEARMYALLALGAVMTAWALLHVLEGRSSGSRETSFPLAQRAWWALYIFGAALTLYAHNLGALVLVALHLLVVLHRRWWHQLPSLALADLFVLLLFGPWLVAVLPGQIAFVEQGYWLSPPALEEVVRTFMLPVLTFYEPAPPWLLAVGLLTGLSLLTILALRALSVRSSVGWFLLLCWLPISLLFVVSYWQPLYLERALLPSALFYLVALGWLLTQGDLPRLLRQSLILLLAAATIGSLGVHYTYARFPRPPFEEATGFLQAHRQPGDAVVHTNKLTYFPMHVYNERISADFLADPPGSPQDTLARPTQEALGIFATSTISEAVGAAGRAWLIYFPREMREARAAMGKHPSVEWIERHFIEVQQKQFGDLVIALYRREDK